MSNVLESVSQGAKVTTTHPGNERTRIDRGRTCQPQVQVRVQKFDADRGRDWDNVMHSRESEW